MLGQLNVFDLYLVTGAIVRLTEVCGKVLSQKYVYKSVKTALLLSSTGVCVLQERVGEQRMMRIYMIIIKDVGEIMILTFITLSGGGSRRI